MSIAPLDAQAPAPVRLSNAAAIATIWLLFFLVLVGGRTAAGIWWTGTHVTMHK